MKFARPITRRTMLASSAGAAATLAFAPSLIAAQEAAPEGLDAIAKRKGLRFGSAIDARDIEDPAIVALLRKDCSILVAENAFKWKQVERFARDYDLERADAIYEFANANEMALRGHTLAWNQDDRIPEWMVRVEDEPEAVRGPIVQLLIEQHVEMMARRYPGISSWDAVNEMVLLRDGSIRSSVLSRALGERIMDVTFHKAREMMPDCQLAYNDYMTWNTNPHHRRGVLELLESSLARGVPIDALGIQGHLVNTAAGDVDERSWREFLDEVRGMGLKVLITELDCADTDLSETSIAARDQAAADHVKAFLDVTLSYDNVTDVLLWDMTDRESYVRSPRYADRRPRADGAVLRAHPYDDNLQPKPMYGAIAAALRAAPER